MPRPGGPQYRSAEGDRLASQLYDRQLAELPFAAHQIDVATPTFGPTHVTVAGPPDGPPLLLWQGAGAPGPFMLSMCAPLVERYRVYAPDTPGRGGRSENVDLDGAAHEWGAWCAELVAALGLLKEGRPLPLQVGISMGGCTLLDLVAVAPHTIRCAALIVPGCLHPGWGSWWHNLRLGLGVSLPIALYCLLPCRFTAWLGLCALMDEPWQQYDSTLVQQLLLFFRHASDTSGARLPRRFSAEQLKGLKAPVLVIAAERDIFGGGQAMAAQAHQLLPNCTSEVVAGCRHMSSRAGMERTCQRVMQFFREHCSA